MFRPLRVNSKQGQYKDREQRKQRRTTDRSQDPYSSARLRICDVSAGLSRAKLLASRTHNELASRNSNTLVTHTIAHKTGDTAVITRPVRTAIQAVIQYRSPVATVNIRSVDPPSSVGSVTLAHRPQPVVVGWLIIGRRAPTEERRCCQRRRTRAALLPGTGGRTR